MFAENYFGVHVELIQIQDTVKISAISTRSRLTIDIFYYL